MPGRLRPDLVCPKCKRDVTCVFHEWSGSRNTATFEYFHKGGGKPCVVVLPYADGQVRYEQESA